VAAITHRKIKTEPETNLGNINPWC